MVKMVKGEKVAKVGMTDGDDGLTPEQREFQKEIEEKRERMTLRKRAETTIQSD